MIEQPESTQRSCSNVLQVNGSTSDTDLAIVQHNVSRPEMFPKSVCDHADRLRLWPLLSSSQQVVAGEDGQNNEFMTVFSHELRNSLGAIRSAVQILSIQPSDGLPAVKARKMIERQVEQMTRLAEDLLDASRTTCSVWASPPRRLQGRDRFPTEAARQAGVSRFRAAN